MEVRLTPEQEAFLQEVVASGRFPSREDAVKEALARLEEDERSRAELNALLEEGEADLEAGRYTEYTDETLGDLVEELKREGRALRDSRRS